MEYVKENLVNISNTLKMTFIELRKIYKGAILGWIWLIAKPSLMIFVYWFAFSVGLRMVSDVNGYSYFIWLLVGLLPWFYISEIIQKGPGILKRYNYLVTKMTFPISTIPTFVSFARIFVNLILTLIVLIIYFITVKTVDIYLIQLPFYMVMMFILFTLLSFLFSFLGAVSKDFSNLIKALTTPILFLSSIFWSVDKLPYEWLKTIQLFNPVTYIVTGYRNTFVDKVWFYEDLLSLGIFLGIVLTIFSITCFVYSRTKREIPDYM